MNARGRNEEAKKQCRKCGLSKPLDEFPRMRSAVDGHRARCKPCHSADVREWTRAKPERQELVRQRVRAWKAANRERQRATGRKRYEDRWRNDPEFRRLARERWRRYRERHAETRAASYRNWASENRARVRARNRAWADRHREKTRAKARTWRLRNREKAKDLSRVSKAKRRARILEAPGTTSRRQLKHRWDYYGGRCWICGENANSIDHVIPLSKGGSNWPSNLRPACLTCNSRKGARELLVVIRRIAADSAAHENEGAP